MPDGTLQLSNVGSGLHSLWGLLVPLGWALWLLWKRYRLLSALLLLGTIGAAWSYVQLPLLQSPLRATASGPLWIRGRLQEAVEHHGRFFLHLLEGQVASPQQEWRVPEVWVSFPAKGRSAHFYPNRPLQLDGRNATITVRDLQLQVDWEEAYFRTAEEPLVGWRRTLASLRLRLEQRVRYYLQGPPQAVFLPLTLGLHTASPALRQLFQESGMAHLLAISGLHMGLLYGLLLRVFRGLGRGSTWLLQQRWFRPGTQGVTLLLLWGYVLFLENPTPAFRAVLMLTLWVLPQWLGWQTPVFHTLMLTASLLLLKQPTLLQDLSFQLSFLAVLGILWGLPGHWLATRGWARVGAMLWNSVWVTVCVLLFVGPVLLHAFGKVTLEAVWLNLVLIPVLALVVLPACLAALLVSLGALGQPPEGWLEQGAFAVVETLLQGWVGLLEALHVPGFAQVSLPGQGIVAEVCVYYTVLLVAGGLLWKKTAPRTEQRLDRLT